MSESHRTGCECSACVFGAGEWVRDCYGYERFRATPGGGEKAEMSTCNLLDSALPLASGKERP